MPEEIPGFVAAAWGVRAAPSRTRAGGLSLARIVEAGLRVAAADGLAAVSMSRVASELGAATMSLYRHVSAKDELLAHMVDAAFKTAPAESAGAEAWRAGLARWATAHLTVLRRHPWLVRVPISGPPLMPNQVLWFERGLECLRGTHLAEREKPSVILLVNGFVRNEATLEADLQIAARASGTPAEDAGAPYGRLLARLTDPDRFPAIHALLADRVFDGPGTPADDFRFGLERILDGVEILVRARADGRDPLATRLS
ncbi:MAG: TetR/AcrR family transcriptional regulator [Vicinamibacterales bacterium]